MKKFKNLILSLVFVFSLVVLASCTIIDDTHIHCFEDGHCDCGEIELEHVEKGVVKVTFLDEEGNLINTIEVVVGTLIPEVQDLEKEGCKFAGWYEGEVKWDFKKMPVSESITLQASFIDNAKYDIIYQLGGGNFEEGEIVETSYVSGIGLAKLPTPVRENYIFLGWYLNGELVDSISALKMGAVTLVAKWESINYEISYDLAGGEFYAGVKVPDNYEEGVGLAELPVAKRAYYIFDGWMLDGELIDKISTDQLGDVKLVAKWTPVEYSIEYDLAGGEHTKDPTLAYNVEEEVELAPATRVGYTFLGWYLNGELVEKVEVGTNGNLKLVAKWQVNEYKLIVNVDGVKEEVVYDYNENVLVPDDPTKVGYTFIGWDKEIPAYMPADDIEIVALWKINQYTLTINVDGVKEEVVYDYNEEVVALKDPAKVGYTFTGWDKEVPANMPANDVELVATWKVNEYKLIVNVDGVKEEVVYDYNEEVSKPANPTKVGYTFTGWDKEIPSYMPANDIEIVALWKINQYTLTINVDGVKEEVVYDYNEEVSKPANPTKVGYTFTGWDKEVPANMPASDLELVATWKVNEYKLIVNVDGVKEEVVYDYNEEVVAPADPTKVGYTFTGWDKEVPAYMPANDVEIVALWEINQYTLTINVDGVKEEVVYDYNEEVVAPKDPTKVGYTFAGWDKEVPANMPANDVELVATWQVNEYTLTINVDGVKEEVVYDYNEEVVAPADPTKVGYTFTGWDKEIPSYMPANDIEIVATWEVTEYTISYTAHEDSLGSSYASVEEAIADFLTDYNTARGKSHTAESFAALGSWGEISDASKFLYDATYRAKWAWLVDYIAEYAGAENKKAYVVFNNYNSQAELNAADGNHIYRIAYELRGWVGQAQYTKNANFVSGNYGDAAVSNAMWKYVARTSYTIESEEFALPAISRPGYVFDGWFDGETKVESVAKGSHDNLVLEARWSLEILTFTLTAEGAQIPQMYGSIDEAIADFLADYNTARGKTHTAESFAALGSWGEISDASNFLYDATYRAKWAWLVDYIAEYAGSENKKAYVVFNNYNSQAELNAADGNHIYRIAYELRGWVGQAQYTKNANFVSGNYGDAAVQNAMWNYVLCNQYTIISEDIELPVIERAGYEFLGWYEGETKYESVPKGTAKDLELVAKWEYKGYNISYELNEGVLYEHYYGPATTTLNISSYDNTGNASGSYFCDTSIKTYNSLRWQYKVLLQYDDAKKAYVVVAIDAAKASAADAATAAGVTWTHAIANSSQNICNMFTLGQLIVLPENLSTGMTAFDATVHEAGYYKYTYIPRLYDSLTDVELPTPERQGFTFGGWYKEAELINRVEKISAGETGDITLYASWIADLSVDHELSEVDAKVFDKVTPTIVVIPGLENAQYNLKYNGTSYGKYTFGSQLFLTLAAATAAAKDGDIIYVAAGTYADEATVSSANVQIIGPNYGIKGTGVRNTEASISGNINVNANGVVIDGVKLTGAAIVYLSALDGCTIQNVYSNSTGMATSIAENGNRKSVIYSLGATKNVSIKDSYFEVGSSVYCKNVITFYFTSTNLTVTGNYFTHTYGGATVCEVITVTNVAGTVDFSNNELRYPTSNFAIMFGAYSNSANVVISNNIIAGKDTYGTAGIYVRNGAKDTTINIEHNYIYGMAGNCLDFKSSKEGSVYKVQYNYFDSATSFKITNAGSGTINYINNYYAATQTTTTSDYGVITSVDKLEEAYDAYLAG